MNFYHEAPALAQSVSIYIGLSTYQIRVFVNTITFTLWIVTSIPDILVYTLYPRQCLDKVNASKQASKQTLPGNRVESSWES